MSNLSNIEQNDNANQLRVKLNAAIGSVGNLQAINETDNAEIVRCKINDIINAINQGGGSNPTDPDVLSSNRVLNILSIGNSLSEDAWVYVPYMLLEYGIKVRMLIFRKSSASLGSLDEHYNTPWNLSTGNDNGKMLFIDTSGETEGQDAEHKPTNWMTVSYENGVYRFRNILDNEWNLYYVPSNYKVKDAVLWNNMKWDLVSVQDFHPSNNPFESGVSTLSSLMSKIKADLSTTSPSCVYGLLSAPTFVQARGVAHYNSTSVILRNKMMYESGLVNMVFPCCTAIANARQIEDYDRLGGTGHLLADNIHLHGGLPCYISSLAAMEALFRRFYPWLSVDGDPSRPYHNNWATGKVIPNEQPMGSGATRIEVTDETAPMCQRFALLANDHPWEIMDEDFIVDGDTTVMFRRSLQHSTMYGFFQTVSNNNGTYAIKKYTPMAVYILPASGYTLTSYTVTVGGTWSGGNYVSGGTQMTLPKIDGVPYFYTQGIKENTLITVTATATE